MHDEMADPLDVRRSALDALVVERVGALRLILAEIDLWAIDRDLRQPLHAVDDFDLKTVRVGQPDALAAAGLVDAFDRRRARRARQFFEIVRTLGVERDADVFRL